MKVFLCQACSQPIYFENRSCGACGSQLGYLPSAFSMVALEAKNDTLVALTPARPALRYCQNIEYDACNWLIDAQGDELFCLACQHNRTIPDLSKAEHLDRWRKMENAKHRLFYSLLRLQLPLMSLTDNPEIGLGFDFLADAPAPAPKIKTGHDDGLITINLNEADDAFRERIRLRMGEPYRTLLGHFRHEVGHYFWDRLVRDAGKLDVFRSIFGDEQVDYSAALKTHYAQGAPLDWQNNYISEYATSHPWEDFAETWAHYLHIIATLDTAASFGLSVQPPGFNDPALGASGEIDAYRADSMESLIKLWLPLTLALNNVNRSMGYADLYPFVISQTVINKLGFIQTLLVDNLRAAGGTGAAPSLGKTIALRGKPESS